MRPAMAIPNPAKPHPPQLCGWVLSRSGPFSPAWLPVVCAHIDDKVLWRGIQAARQ